MIKLLVKIMPRVSGVVINQSGGLSDIFFFLIALVSPCLISRRNPRQLEYFSILLKTSLFNDRSGVMYKALIPLYFSTLESLIMVNTGRIAASVLPEPVGAISIESFLLQITGRDLAWIFVRFVKPWFR